MYTLFNVKTLLNFTKMLIIQFTFKALKCGHSLLALKGLND